MPEPQQRGIQAMSATYTTAHGNAWPLAYWARPGIELASLWVLVRLVSTEPQWELWKIFKSTFSSNTKVLFPNPHLETLSALEACSRLAGRFVFHWQYFPKSSCASLGPGRSCANSGKSVSLGHSFFAWKEKVMPALSDYQLLCENGMKCWTKKELLKL